MFPSPSASAAASGAVPRPNFVVVFADDLGWGDLGAFGQEQIETPRLDRMALEGQRWTAFYAGDAWCPASRNSLLAGLHTGHTVLRGVGVLPEETGGVPRFLPERLRREGYEVAMFGKWGLGTYETDGRIAAFATGGRPSHLGFDRFVGLMKHRDAHTHELPPYPQEPGDSQIHPVLWTIQDGDTVELPETTVTPFLPDLFLEEAIAFLREERSEPFFLYFPTALPHAEYYLPADDPGWRPYVDEEGVSVFPEVPWPGDPSFRRPVPAPKATYAALVSRLDRDVGLLLDTLVDEDLHHETLVLFLSDNGPAGGGGFENPDFFGSAGGLRGLKRSLYEGGIRVPMLAWWPGTIPAETVVDAPAAVWDVPATLLELAGGPAYTDLDGISLVPALLDAGVPAHDETAPLYRETSFFADSQALRVGPWKLVRPVIEGADDPVELYDLSSDPGETTDLADRPEHCERRRSLIDLMNQEHLDAPLGGFPVPPLSVDCPLLVDGFESGDTSEWDY